MISEPNEAETRRKADKSVCNKLFESRTSCNIKHTVETGRIITASKHRRDNGMF